MPPSSRVVLSETFCSYSGYAPIAGLVPSLLPTAAAHSSNGTKAPGAASNPPPTNVVIGACARDRVNRTTAKACVAIPPVHLPKPKSRESRADVGALRPYPGRAGVM
jgi:hypothetical protein